MWAGVLQQVRLAVPVRPRCSGNSQPCGGAEMRPRIGGAAGTFFSKDEVRALLAVARAHSERDWLLILVTVTHGLRASEAVGLTAGDVRDGHLWVARLKGSARTCQPLVGEERDALLTLCTGKQPSDRLFPITRQHYWRIFQRYCRMAGLDPIASHPHSLKHACAHIVLDETGNLLHTQKYLGHAAITSTAAYLKPTEAESCRAAAAGLQFGEDGRAVPDTITEETDATTDNDSIRQPVC